MEGRGVMMDQAPWIGGAGGGAIATPLLTGAWNEPMLWKPLQFVSSDIIISLTARNLLSQIKPTFFLFHFFNVRNRWLGRGTVSGRATNGRGRAAAGWSSGNASLNRTRVETVFHRR
jgi:hypothetical protein